MTICYPDTMTVKRDIQRRVEDYLTVKLKSLEYCKNQPHKLTAFM